MTTEPTIIDVTFTPPGEGDPTAHPGVVAVTFEPDKGLPRGLGALDRAMRKGLGRAIASERGEKMKPGDVLDLPSPGGVEAASVVLICLPRGAEAKVAHKAGAALARIAGKRDTLLIAPGRKAPAADLAYGAALGAYRFDWRRSERDDPAGALTVACDDPEGAKAAWGPLSARALGVAFTRDLTNEPANHLTTLSFTERLEAMRGIGLEVEVLDEAAMERLGMGALLCVGQGSDSPSRLVAMRWNGGGDEAPLALVGKGVVFDTGGISIKPAAGMEQMTMDMGGAGVVAGVMRTLALRGARANVVGLVGLVENMPSGAAVRPGDVVTSMKGDTIEVINTDAEGRLVLADALWYAQRTYAPRAVIDLATLTGAIIVALGYEHAGVFSNHDGLADDLTAAARSVDEGAWRLPMGPAYDKLLKSRVADMRNVGGGRAGGSITAAQFLARFVEDGTPWAHIDIAGVASIDAGTDLAPKGATGWGVATLDALVAAQFETDG
ncbi:MAG: leucyl aminopeptidase [Paracoccaceae bacterium]